MHIKFSLFGILLFLFITLSCKSREAGNNTEHERDTVPEFYAWAETPPMGWNSWDCYGPTVKEDEIKANADYMAEHLREFGWEYIVVDIRWFVENTKRHGYNQTDPVYVLDEYGRFMPAVNRFPSAAGKKGFKPLADYIHSKGLKFGIHIMRGIPVEAVKRKLPVLGTDVTADQIYTEDLQCLWLRDMYTIVADRPGAQEYYNSIFDLYASWGVDYIKVDNLCNENYTGGYALYHKDEIEMIRNAIDQCGRPIVLSTSPGQTPQKFAEHIMTHANMWRITNDFWDLWSDLKNMFQRCSEWNPYRGHGHWPDADMMPLGRISIRGERGDDRMTRFTPDEQYTHVNLWAIFRSPLMFGGDLPSNDEFTLSLITNEEVLAVNQNSTNNRELKNDDGLIVWIADVPGTEAKYIAMFNTRDEKSEIIVSLDEMGLKGKHVAKDLWTREEEKIGDGVVKRELRPHASVMLKIGK